MLEWPSQSPDPMVHSSCSWNSQIITSTWEKSTVKSSEIRFLTRKAGDFFLILTSNMAAPLIKNSSFSGNMYILQDLVVRMGLKLILHLEPTTRSLTK